MANRPLAFEKLESRTVLSVGALAPFDAAATDAIDVTVTFELTDANGQVRSALETGERFYLNVFVQDTRADAQGVFGAGLDLLYDHELVVLDGPISFGSLFPNGTSAAWDQPGLLDEVFGCGGLTPSGADRLLFARVPFLAVAPGMASFVADPSDTMFSEVLVYGSDFAVSSDRIRYDSLAIDITGDSCADTVQPAPVSLPEPPAPVETDSPEATVDVPVAPVDVPETTVDAPVALPDTLEFHTAGPLDPHSYDAEREEVISAPAPVKSDPAQAPWHDELLRGGVLFHGWYDIIADTAVSAESCYCLSGFQAAQWVPASVDLDAAWLGSIAVLPALKSTDSFVRLAAPDNIPHEVALRAAAGETQYDWQMLCVGPSVAAGPSDVARDRLTSAVGNAEEPATLEPAADDAELLGSGLFS